MGAERRPLRLAELLLAALEMRDIGEDRQRSAIGRALVAAQTPLILILDLVRLACRGAMALHSFDEPFSRLARLGRNIPETDRLPEKALEGHPRRQEPAGARHLLPILLVADD